MPSYDLSGISVLLAMPVHRDMPVQTVAALLETQDLMRARDIPFEAAFQVGNSLVETARSKLAARFLESGANRLFWVDSDIAWQASDFLRLLAFSTRLDIVGGAYPAKKEPETILLDLDSPDVETNDLGCFQVGGMGLGFCCVSREVIERLSLSSSAPVLAFPDLPEPIPHLFRCDSIDGKFRGEDMAFFSDARELGYGVWIDPAVTLGHIGSKTYAADLKSLMMPKGGHGDEQEITNPDGDSRDAKEA